MRVRAIVTDIEGTTSDLHFVSQTLLPYSVTALPDFVRKHLEDETVNTLIAETAEIAGLNADDTEALISQLVTWIKTDQKVTPLKTLQGLVWEAGYQKGAFQAHLYPDAFEKLEAWYQAGIPLYAYGAGSVKAQELFFEHSIFGDLRYLFSDYFDSQTGSKTERDSYHNISFSIGIPQREILFLSDVLEELKAAKSAGFQTAWVRRDTGLLVNEVEARHAFVRSFEEIKILT